MTRIFGSGEGEPSFEQLTQKFSGPFDYELLSDKEMLLIARNCVSEASIHELAGALSVISNRNQGDKGRRDTYLAVASMAAKLAASPEIPPSRMKSVDTEFQEIMTRSFAQSSQTE